MDASSLFDVFDLIDENEERLSAVENVVKLALPQIKNDPSTLSKLLERLGEIGVECPKDLEELEESDIGPDILKPIQLRKLLKFCKIKENEISSSNQVLLSTDHSELHPSTSASTAKSLNEVSKNKENNCSVVEESWLQRFKVDINCFDKNIQKALTAGKRLKKKQRLQVVRSIITCVLKFCARPRKSELQEVARIFHDAYPRAIIDEVDGEVLGCGFQSFSKQLRVRIENLARDESNDMPTLKKTKRNPRILREVCVNAKPRFEGNDLETAKEAQKELLELAQSVEKDYVLMKELLTSSYTLQRENINNLMEGTDLKQNWPLLFELYGINVHLNILLQKDIFLLFEEFFEDKSERLLKFFSKRKKTSKIKQILTRFKKGTSADKKSHLCVGTIILLIMEFFKEDSSLIFPIFEPGTPTDDILKCIPEYPCLIILGENLVQTSYLMLSLDRCIVNDHIRGDQLISALSGFFGLYFMANVKYPEAAECTLEFLQRIVTKINPKNINVKKASVNPKVLTLINMVSNFEWTTGDSSDLEDEEE